jgi:arsenate reductase
MSERKRVLFLCTGNSCRSQMAEGWARQLRSNEVQPYSAGTHPSELNPLAVKVMAEARVDISKQQPKHVNDLHGIEFDIVVTVCDAANESCPVLPGTAKRLHVAFDDPPKLAASAKNEEEALSHYRRVRDEIKAFVEGMPDNLESQA